MNCRIAASGFVDIHFPAKLPQRVNSQIYSGANVFRMCRIRGHGWSFNKSLEQRFVFLTMRFGKRIKLIAIRGASHAGHPPISFRFVTASRNPLNKSEYKPVVTHYLRLRRKVYHVLWRRPKQRKSVDAPSNLKFNNEGTLRSDL